jgi:hypothetical protein
MQQQCATCENNFASIEPSLQWEYQGDRRFKGPHYCSEQCGARDLEDDAVTVQCDACYITFSHDDYRYGCGKFLEQNFCTPVCAKALRTLATRTCGVCGTDFLHLGDPGRRAGTNLCSKACAIKNAIKNKEENERKMMAREEPRQWRPYGKLRCEVRDVMATFIVENDPRMCGKLLMLARCDNSTVLGLAVAKHFETKMRGVRLFGQLSAQQLQDMYNDGFIVA